MSPSDVDALAALAAAQAVRLRAAAAAVRQHASSLVYHPVTRKRPRTPPEALTALDDVEAAVAEVQRGTGARDAAVAALRDSDPRGAALAQQAAEVDRTAQVVVASIGVLRPLLTGGEDATLDAPYGHGAPRRHHPGALATMVAERAEMLAQALDLTAVLAANIARATARGT